MCVWHTRRAFYVIMIAKVVYNLICMLYKLAMAYNWKPLVSSANPTGGALVV